MVENYSLRIKYHNKDLTRLCKFDQGDWIDLRSAESVALKAGEFKLISLGISVELPPGCELNIVPRSSTYIKFGVIQANHFGVIDESYNGDDDIIYFPAIALRDTHIPFDARICQCRLNKKQPNIYFKVVDSLDNKNRGGLGSTGVF